MVLSFGDRRDRRFWRHRRGHGSHSQILRDRDKDVRGADEEPEIYSARRDGLESMIPEASPGRVAVVLLVAIAAGVGGALLF